MIKRWLAIVPIDYTTAKVELCDTQEESEDIIREEDCGHIQEITIELTKEELTQLILNGLKDSP